MAGVGLDKVKLREEHEINRRRKSSIISHDVLPQKRIARIFIEEVGRETVEGKSTFKTIVIPSPCPARFCKDLLRMKNVVQKTTTESYELVEVHNVQDLRVVKDEEDIVALMDGWPKDNKDILKLVYKDPSRMRRVLKIELDNEMTKTVAVTGDMTAASVCSLLARKMKMVDTSEFRVLAQVEGQATTMVGMEENLFSVLHSFEGTNARFYFKRPADLKEGVVEVLRTPYGHEEIPQFEVLSLLGKGGFGKVWKVRHRETGEILALKVLRKRGVVERSMVEHTKVEQHAMRVVQHPFIIRLHQSFQSGERLFLLMEYLEGGTLFERIRDRPAPFSEHEARFYAAQIILAMTELHKEGFIYRDLKLENIMLDSDGNVRLMDFGLSHYDPDYNGVNSFSGTAIYLAPEILQNVPHGPMVDWWCLGVALFLLLCQEPPFWHEEHKKLFEEINRSEPFYEEMTFLSENSLSLLKGLLTKDPAQRLGKGGLEEVKRHPFFEGLDWDQVLSKELKPPIPIEGDSDHAVFIPKDDLDDIFVDPEDADGAPPPDLFEGFSFEATSSAAA